MKMMTSRRQSQSSRRQESSSEPPSSSSSSSSTSSSSSYAESRRTTTSSPSQKKKRTLYDVLEGHPDMTRAELKKQYVKLARVSHPDAIRQRQQQQQQDEVGNNESTAPSTSSSSSYDFTEIAAAWEILSDKKQRQRYDRSLQAEQFAQQVETWAGRNIQPFVTSVAIPFIRKTTNVAAAVVQKAAVVGTATNNRKDTSNNDNSDNNNNNNKKMTGTKQSPSSKSTRDNINKNTKDNDNDYDDNYEEQVIILTPEEMEDYVDNLTSTTTTSSSSSLFTSTNTNKNRNKPKGFAPTPNGNNNPFESKSNVQMDEKKPQQFNDDYDNNNNNSNSNQNTDTNRSNRDPSARFQQSTMRKQQSFDQRNYHKNNNKDYIASVLWDKAQILEARAAAERDQAMEVLQQWETLVRERRALALHTPQSGLTAHDAAILLEDLNQTGITDRLSPLDRAMLRHTVWEEIQALQSHETEFCVAQQADSAAQDFYRDTVQRRVLNVEQLSVAIEQEDAARRAWIAAQEAVQDARKSLVDTTRALAQAEIQAKKSDYELQCTTVDLEQQSERVRKALRHKQDQVRHVKHAQEQQFQNDMEHVNAYDENFDDWEYNDDESPERYEILKDMLAEEQFLQQASHQMELLSARLESRAQKLRMRAEELENRND